MLIANTLTLALQKASGSKALILLTSFKMSVPEVRLNIYHSHANLELGNIQQCQNLNNIVAYVRGGEACPGQELYIYDDYHDRDASKILFQSKIKTLKLSTNW